MIVAEQKSMEEIYRICSPYEKILILGCGTCVTVCDAGGEKEVSIIHSVLDAAQARTGDKPHIFSEYTVKRQCDIEFLEALKDKAGEIDAILSLGCGIGVQSLAEVFPDIPILPGVNTAFMGASREWGVWDERCVACGDCRLVDTGGICPITRCAKGILNGPCAGAKGGKCEANKEMDCAWVLIYQHLVHLGHLERMRQYYPPRNFHTILRPRRLIIKTEINPGGK
ncbi:methylenetetrahydrofolate reductase C-terminal domain-containing protein [bacterium]|nr:methylenetetrahydrofolate reductase C-terminal domain-containing protein [bacterium]